MIELRSRYLIKVTLIVGDPAPRDEAAFTVVAKVSLRRFIFVRARRRFRAGCIDGYKAVRNVAVAGFHKELLNHSFGFVVFALAEMMVTHAPVGIDAIVRGPIFVT